MQITCNPTAWVSCSTYMPRSRRIVAAATDSTVSFYGIVRGVYDLMGRLPLKGVLGVPRCLCIVEAEEDDFASCGDDEGVVALLLTDSGEAVQRGHFTKCKPEYVDILYRHTDWVTKVRL